MTAFAPGGRLWTRRSGYSSYSLFLRLRGPRRRNRRPCITFGSTPVRHPLRHRCTTTPPSRPITIPPQPSSWLESSIPPTLAGRECSASSKYLRFVHRPSRFFTPSSSLSPPSPHLHRLLFFFSSPLSFFIVG